MSSTHPTLLNIPNNAKLIAFGNCFHSEQYGWQIATFFRMPNKEIKTIFLAIETLPILALGRIYRKGNISVEQKEIIHFSLPPIASWEKLTMREVPTMLYDTHFSSECQNQLIYKITLENKIFWLPVLELARVLFLKTAENSRRAFYESSLFPMANLNLSQGQAVIQLSKHYPRKLLDTKSHQQYLAWLLLNPDVTKSFCSIYQSKNENLKTTQKFQRWIFDFKPFELRNVTTNCFVSSHEQEYFIFEISSLARIPTTTQYKKVVIEHPEDIKYLAEQNKGSESEKDPSDKKKVNISKIIDDKKTPSGHTKHRVLDIPKGRLHFNALIEPSRHFNEVTVEPKHNKSPKRAENGEEEEGLGLTEGDSKNKSRKVDFKTLADPNEEPSDFFKHIRIALKHIQETKNWQINERTAELSHDKPKSFLSIGGAKRRYFCAEITLAGDTIAKILEIDLTDKHGLSTLVLRLAPSSDTDNIDLILDALVEKSGRWNKELIHDLADICAYVTHPKSLSEKTEVLVYENWGNRIISEL